MDALGDVEQGITTIEGQQRTCAQSVAQTAHVSKHHTARLMAMGEDLRNYKNYIEQTIQHDPDSTCTKFVKRNERFEGNDNNTAEVIAMQLSRDTVLESKQKRQTFVGPPRSWAR